MNPDTNKFEKLVHGSVRPDGSPVPEHWSIFTVGEEVTIKDYTFKVAYIGESAILFEPVGPRVLDNDSEVPYYGWLEPLPDEDSSPTQAQRREWRRNELRDAWSGRRRW